MMKLHQQLEAVLKVRVNSNSDIIAAIKKLSEMGKLDKPKELAMFAVILDRLGKMEDEKLIEESVKEVKTNETIEDLATLDLSSTEEELKEEIQDKIEAQDAFVESITDTQADPEFKPENITDPKPQDTEPQAT